jgi:hypothetical protein
LKDGIAGLEIALGVSQNALSRQQVQLFPALDRSRWRWVVGAHRGLLLGVLLPKPDAAFDIGEEKGDRAAG